MTWRRVTVVAAGAACLLASCSSDSPSTLSAAGSEARHLAGLWWLLFGLATAVYLIVGGFVVWSILRGRRRHPDRDSPRDRTFIWWGGLIVPSMILVVVGVVTVTTSNAIRQPRDDALVVEVVGTDWWWEVRYPEEGVVTANEIHVPVDRPISFRLRTRDVIHSFWVPEIAGKLDMIPGETNHLDVVVEKTGVFRGLCAEYCGIQHAHMGLLVIAQEAGEFERWVARMSRPAAEPTSELEARGRLVFETSECAGCHTVRGTEATGDVGPDLTHVASRRTLGAVTIDNTPENMREWVHDPHQFKPGVLMPPSVLSDDQIRAIVAYLQERR